MGLRSFKERMLSKMAEFKNKPHLNGSAKLTKESPLQAVFKLLKNVQTDSQEFKSYDQLLNDKVEIEKQLHNETNAKQELTSQHNQLRAEFIKQKQEAKRKEVELSNTFGERYQAWKQNESVTQNCIDETEKLKASLQTKRADGEKQQANLIQLEIELRSARAKEKELVVNLEKMSNQAKRVNAKLQQCELDGRLHQAEIDLGEGTLLPFGEAQAIQLYVSNPVGSYGS